MISGIRPLLLLLIVFLPALLRAQDGSASQTRMVGSTADSVTGGPPSVMVGRVSPVDYYSTKQNLIGVDPLKSMFYYNASYFRGLNSSWMMGGGLQLAPGFDGGGSRANGFGIQAGAGYFFAGEGAHGWHTDATLHFYSVKVGDKNQTPISFTLDGSYLWDFGLFFLDCRTGAEYFLVPIEEPEEQYPGEYEDYVALIGLEGQKFGIHLALILGVHF